MSNHHINNNMSELSEDTKFNISIKTLIAIGVAIFTLVGMWFALQEDIEEAKKLRRKIKGNEGMYSWRFQECETEECKEILVKQFLKQLFKVEL